MQDSKATELFEKAPISQAVLKSALPAMAAMLMMLIYNLADTFFVGQTHDAYQVAAVSLAMPVFFDVYGSGYCVWHGRHVRDFPCVRAGENGIRQKSLLVLYVGMCRRRRCYGSSVPDFYGFNPFLGRSKCRNLGLRYGSEDGTPFTQTITGFDVQDDTVNFTVNVRNDGDTAGKSVV